MEQIEGTAVRDFDRAFETVEPGRLASPLVFSSPHSGSTYPPRFLAASRSQRIARATLTLPSLCLGLTA